MSTRHIIMLHLYP